MTNKKTTYLAEFDASAKRYSKQSQKYAMRAQYGSVVFKMLAIIFLFLLVIAFTRKAYSSTPITFTSLLNWLGSIDGFQLNVSVSDFFIYGSWGVFDGLRNFFNIFTTMFGVLVFMFSNLINLISFISQFVLFIFA